MKPIMLAFRPDTIDVPFSHAIVPIYVYSDFLAVKSLLDNELRPYRNVCAIDDDNQANRLQLIAIAELMKFNSVELDEQIGRGTLSVEELDELKAGTSLPIGITSTINPILNFLMNGARPDFIFIECYSDMPDLDYLKTLAGNTPVYGVINIADSTNLSSEPEYLRAWSSIIWSKLDGIWFWGWNTGVPSFEAVAQQNYPVLKQIVMGMQPPYGLLGLLVGSPLMASVIIGIL